MHFIHRGKFDIAAETMWEWFLGGAIDPSFDSLQLSMMMEDAWADDGNVYMRLPHLSLHFATSTAVPLALSCADR